MKIKKAFYDFLEPEEIKIGYKNFIKYVKVNIKIEYKFIKRIILEIRDLFKYYTYQYWYIKNNKDFFDEIFYHNHDHYLEILTLIIEKLKLMKKELKKDYDFDPKDMERLNDIINLGDQLLKIIKEKGLVEKDQEYQKLAKSFFNKLYRLHNKLYSIKDFQSIKN